MRDQLTKIENFFTSFGEYSHASKVENLKRICFQSILSEILYENKLVARYPQVRYQFNLLKSKSIVSDYKSVKIILKNLMLNAFQSAAASGNPLVSLSIESADQQIYIQISSSGGLMDGNFTRNIFRLFYRGSNPSENLSAGLFLIKDSIKKLKGKILLSSSSTKSSALNITIPDLESQHNEKHILPNTSAALRIV